MRNLFASCVFPSLASLWWIPCLFVIGWGPLFLLDAFRHLFPGHGDEFAGAGLAYGFTITLVSMLLALVLALGHVLRFAKLLFRSAFEISEESDRTSLFGPAGFTDDKQTRTKPE
jgi:hypothetical protein